MMNKCPECGEEYEDSEEQESSPQKEVKEILNDINKAINVWDNYQEAKVFHCPFNKDKCEEIKQARAEMINEIKRLLCDDDGGNAYISHPTYYIRKVLEQLEKEGKE